LANFRWWGIGEILVNILGGMKGQMELYAGIRGRQNGPKAKGKNWPKLTGDLMPKWIELIEKVNELKIKTTK
jgi:hypothetical protein